MYIKAKTVDGDTLYWTGIRWSDSFADAESYGAMSGSFEAGKLEVRYIDGDETYYGTRIHYIYTE